MAERRENVRLVLNDSFTGRLAAAAAAAERAFDDITLAQATWEPHDWSDFA